MRGGPHLDDLLDWAWDYGATVTWRRALGQAWRCEIVLADGVYAATAESVDVAAAFLMRRLEDLLAAV
jgi:hypothetical protein